MNFIHKSIDRLYAVLSIGLLVISTTLCFIPVLFLGLLKLIPNPKWKIICTKQVDLIAIGWNDINNAYLSRIYSPQWEITGLENLRFNNWYLIIANHQSWLDIVVLQYLFNRKIPVLKFFLKSQLKWIPLLGFSWWAMGFPFMKRYTKEYLAKKPHKKGDDLHATRKATEIFKNIPSSVMNFVEGTRFAPQKKEEQQSPYQNLLKPRAGGLSYVVGTMGEQFNCLLDVSIVYPTKMPTLWNFLCRKIDSIKVHIRQITIPVEFTNAALVQDEQTQIEFRNWLNTHWLEKDHIITQLKKGEPHDLVTSLN